MSSITDLDEIVPTLSFNLTNDVLQPSLDTTDTTFDSGQRSILNYMDRIPHATATSSSDVATTSNRREVASAAAPTRKRLPRGSKTSNMVINSTAETATTASTSSIEEPSVSSLTATTTITTSNNNNSTDNHILIVDDRDSSSQCIDLTKESDDVFIINTTSSRTDGRTKASSTTRLARRKISNRARVSEDQDGVIHVQNGADDPNATIILDDSSEASPAPNPITSTQQMLHQLPLEIDLLTPLALNTFSSFQSTLLPPPPPSALSPTATRSMLTSIVPNQSSIIADVSGLGSLSRASPSKRARINAPSTTVVVEKTVTPAASTSSLPTCPICLENLDELKQHGKLLMATFCGHVLCNHCLGEHFKSGLGSGASKSILCPTCRTKLTKNKIHMLYL